MNESLYVYLNLDTEKEQESEELIRRMDRLLLTARSEEHTSELQSP